MQNIANTKGRINLTYTNAKSITRTLLDFLSRANVWLELDSTRAIVCSNLARFENIGQNSAQTRLDFEPSRACSIFRVPIRPLLVTQVLSFQLIYKTSFLERQYFSVSTHCEDSKISQ